MTELNAHILLSPIAIKALIQSQQSICLLCRRLQETDITSVVGMNNEAFEGEAVFAPYYSKDKTTLYAKWLTEEEWLASLDGTSFEKAFIAESGKTYDVNVQQADKSCTLRLLRQRVARLPFNPSAAAIRMAHCIVQPNRL